MAEIPQSWTQINHKPTCNNPILAARVSENFGVKSGVDESYCGHGYVYCITCKTEANQKAHIHSTGPNPNGFPSYEEFMKTIEHINQSL